MKTAILLPLCLFVSSLEGTMLTRKYAKAVVPHTSWIPEETFPSVKSSLICESMAWKRNKYLYSFSEDNGVCEVGSADLAGVGSGDKAVLLRDIPQVGLSHGNDLGDTDFEIVLPNGAVCPPSDHGLPGLDPGVGAPRYRHALAEAEGVVYLCGGKLTSNNAYLDECFKLDLQAATPSWAPIAPMPNVIQPINGGLVSYTDGQGLVRLFAMATSMCDSLYIYSVSDNTWESVDVIQPVFASRVDFIPLSGSKSAGPCESLGTLPVKRSNAYMVNFGNGQAALYGGFNGIYTDKIFLWNPAKQEMEDVGATTPKRLDYTGFGSISSSLVMKQCWKYL